MTPLIQSMWKMVPNPHESVWFDLGEIPTQFEVELLPEMVTHLPFDDITIVGRSNKPFVVHAAASGQDTIVTTGFVLMPEFVRLPALVCRLAENGHLKVFRRDKKEFTRDENMKVIAPIQILVSRLAASSMTAYRPEVPTTFTNTRKIAKGKQPSFVWRTVTIKARNETASSEQTGTHSSPRAHERRGHWRTLPKGRVWVKPCRVGDFKRNGLVLHDYKVHHETNHIPKP